MKAIPIEPNDKEKLSNLIDIMGLVDGGINEEEFFEIKDQMMNSGITSEGLMNLFETDLLKNLLQRPAIPTKIQRLTDTAKILMDAFMPGPITVIRKKILKYAMP
jgi:hypothetical protein